MLRRVAFRVVLPRRHPESVFSELNGQPAYTPVPRFKCLLAERPRRARGQDGSLLLSCMTLSFTTPRRFIPTLSERFLPKLYSSLIYPVEQALQTISDTFREPCLSSIIGNQCSHYVRITDNPDGNVKEHAGRKV